MGRTYPDQLTVVLDENMERAILSELSGMGNKAQKASVTAVRKTMRSAETSIAKNYRQNVNLKSSEIKDRITIERKPSSQVPSGVIRISGSRIPLWKFSRSMSDLAGFTSQKGKSFKERKPKGGAGWKVYKIADKKIRRKNYFVDRETKSSQIQIFTRPVRGASGGENAKSPQDYRTAFGPSLMWMDRKRNIIKPALVDIAKVLERNLRSQVDRFLQRKKSDRA